MFITLQLNAEVSRGLGQRALVADLPQAALDLQRLIRDAGARLEPLHPGADDPQLTSFFAVHATDPMQVETLMQRLRQHPAVLAAYIKPADELP
jgi:hypothetical protein